MVVYKLKNIDGFNEGKVTGVGKSNTNKRHVCYIRDNAGVVTEVRFDSDVEEWKYVGTDQYYTAPTVSPARTMG